MVLYSSGKRGKRCPSLYRTNAVRYRERAVGPIVNLNHIPFSSMMGGDVGLVLPGYAKWGNCTYGSTCCPQKNLIRTGFRRGAVFLLPARISAFHVSGLRSECSGGAAARRRWARVRSGQSMMSENRNSKGGALFSALSRSRRRNGRGQKLKKWLTQKT